MKNNISKILYFSSDDLKPYNNYKKPKMWRKRYIPYEIINISQDEVLYRDDRLIVTRWETIHPRADFQKGISFIFLDEGIKISKLYKENGEFFKYYCDIIDVVYNSEEDEYVFIDLLLDVEIYPNEEVKVLDMDELEAAEKEGLVTKEQAEMSRMRLNKLLETIKTNNFPPEVVNKNWEEC